MADYSPFGIAKSRAKDLKKSRPDLRLNQAQELYARQIGFTGFHDLTTVGRRNSHDFRLMKAAFGIENFKDAIHEDPAFSEFSEAIEDMMSEAIAGTNASAFEVDLLEVKSTTYDDSTGVLKLNVNFTYSGEQLEDRHFSGTAFYVSAAVNLVCRDSQWSLNDDFDEPIEIKSSESDQERDWAEQELEWDEFFKKIEPLKEVSTMDYFAINQHGIYFGVDDRIKLDEARFQGEEFYGMLEVHEHAGLNPHDNYGRPGDEDVAAQFDAKHTLYSLHVKGTAENQVITCHNGQTEFEIVQDVTTFVNEFTGE